MRERTRLYKIGGKAMKLHPSVYEACKERGVGLGAINHALRRYQNMGIPASYNIAALRALEDAPGPAREERFSIGSHARRGQTGPDLLTVFLVLATIAFLGLLAAKVWSDFNTQAQNIDSLPAASKTASASIATNLPAGLDIGIVVALGILSIGLFITSRFIGTHPVFFWFNVFLLLFVLGVGALTSNVFDQATNTASFVTERAAMPATVWIMGHLLEVGIAEMAIILLGYFAKPEGA